MVLIKIMNAHASRIKGTDYVIDPAIADSYLLRVAIERISMKLRGIARFPTRRPRPFVGPGTTFYAKRQLSFGAGVSFAQGVYVDSQSRNGVTLGANVSLGRNSRIECTGSLKSIGIGFEAGNDVGLGTDNFYGAAGGISIGADTIVGNFTSFHSENHESSDLATPIRLQGVQRQGIRIGQDCWIGAKVTVLDGVNLGDHCIVAAGAVLRAGNYPANGIYAGVPAKLVKKRGD